ncbi:amidohydrolase [Escherichia coli]|uniref:amidohydrolase n=1 Tax=Escherichia coli TaxID=562 RepID=UPI0002CC6E24|nr:amidohydrolase [Escherichia coli]ENA20357.1 amidohydrolase family protein [Escherichia coli P0298942.1]ENB01489.1 amidohydrolase family protein [Escherichia coli 2862600]ENB43158.1 amidohydrolase family protein [Escherichia coli P0298942.10]ENB49403.1 amidohydrolase family protein [Escherichia coli P0298942.11]ENB64343.1 amidohydrolase family protein [Escherichia coli P0298942.15]
MQEIYRFIDDAIEADRQRYTDIADQIWDHPETRFEEFWSAEHLASALESAGFTVTRNVGNIPNAFIASFGQGKPVIALLGEYDALAGLSQQAGCAQPTSVTPGENGHGCGHNLLGTAAFAAAIAVKKWLEQYGQGGTVRFYGCPGEEGGSGKTFMVREGVFDDVDAALTWHPEAFAGMFNTRTLANIQASWRFKGIAAHAANSPHLGRSALDAVTLMTTGTNFLNEHIIEKFAQILFRIADSSVLPLAPVSPFVPLFLGFLQRYKPDAKLGTYYSLVLPYPLIFLVVWLLMLLAWYLVGLPIGPGISPRLS